MTNLWSKFSGLIVLLIALIIGYVYYQHTEKSGEHFYKKANIQFTCKNVFSHLPAIAIPRPSGSKGSAEVASYIQSQFSSKYWEFEEDAHVVSDTPLGPITYRNLIFTHRSRSPTQKTILLAAHYDSKVLEAHGQQLSALSPQMIEESTFIGATDAAFSCALIIALAQSIEFLQLRYPLQIVFFDGEEAIQHWTPTDSLYGSRHLAQKWSQTGDLSARFQLMILLDLLGSASPPHIYPFHPPGSTEYRHFQKLLEIQKEIGGNIFSSSLQFAHLRGEAIEDDHTPFQKHQVPVLHLIPAPFPDIWHTPKDDLSAINESTACSLSLILHQYLLDLLQKKGK